MNKVPFSVIVPPRYSGPDGSLIATLWVPSGFAIVFNAKSTTLCLLCPGRIKKLKIRYSPSSLVLVVVNSEAMMAKLEEGVIKLFDHCITLVAFALGTGPPSLRVVVVTWDVGWNNFMDDVGVEVTLIAAR